MLLQPDLCLWLGPGAYPRVEHQKGASLRPAAALRANIRIVWKGLPGINILA
jgi:hypothetical protein